MSVVFRSRARLRALARAASFVGVTLGLVACAAHDEAPDDELELELGYARPAIVGGETDPTRRAVLAVGSFDDKGIALCTGTLIAPNLVLTARHCVTPTHAEVVSCDRESFGPPSAASSIGVTPATNALDDGRFFGVAEVFVPDAAESVCGGDIALLRTSEAFPPSVAEPIAPRLDRPVQSGELYTAVGYGLSLDEGVGTRRTREGLEVTCGPLDCPGSDAFARTEFVGDEGICQGDSGGPALDPEGRLVGIVSRGTEGCELAVYSAVSEWREWIRAIAERAMIEGGYAPPAWLVPSSIDVIATAEGSRVAATTEGTPGAELDVMHEGELGGPAASTGCAVGGRGSASRRGSGAELWLLAAGLLVGLFRRARAHQA